MNNNRQQLEENHVTFRSYTEKPNRVVEVICRETEGNSSNAGNASYE